MTSKEAVKVAYTELQIQNIFEDNEEDNQWHKNVINGLKNAENDLEVLDIIKNKQVDIQDIIDVEGDFEFYHSYCIGKGYANEYICNKKEFKKINRWLNNGK